MIQDTQAFNQALAGCVADMSDLEGELHSCIGSQGLVRRLKSAVAFAVFILLLILVVRDTLHVHVDTGVIAWAVAVAAVSAWVLAVPRLGEIRWRLSSLQREAILIESALRLVRSSSPAVPEINPLGEGVDSGRG